MFFAVNTDEREVEGGTGEIEREREKEREREGVRKRGRSLEREREVLPGGAHGMNFQWHVSNTRHARSCDARW